MQVEAALQLRGDALAEASTTGEVCMTLRGAASVVILCSTCNTIFRTGLMTTEG